MQDDSAAPRAHILAYTHTHTHAHARAGPEVGAGRYSRSGRGGRGRQQEAVGRPRGGPRPALGRGWREASAGVSAAARRLASAPKATVHVWRELVSHGAAYARTHVRTDARMVVGFPGECRVDGRVRARRAKPRRAARPKSRVAAPGPRGRRARRTGRRRARLLAGAPQALRARVPQIRARARVHQIRGPARVRADR